jgi:hypothetical protein
MDLKELRWSGSHPVDPTAGTWEMKCPPDPHAFKVPPPPANESAETANELAELERLTHNRTVADIEQILHWSADESSPLTHWSDLADEYIRAYGLGPPAGARIQFVLAEAMYGALIACWAAKYQYLRPRPGQLDPDIAINIIPVPEHPSYPSGHSTGAGAASKVLRHFFPAESGKIRATAENSGLSRLKAGIHYRSDHEAGFRLGREYAKAVLASIRDDGGPQVYR